LNTGPNRWLVALQLSEPPLCDVFQNMASYRFTGSLGSHHEAEQVEMLVIPTSFGNTHRQIQLIKKVVNTAPSYLLHLYRVLVNDSMTPRTDFAYARHASVPNCTGTNPLQD
jgi:hypothetical protein